MPSLIQEKGGEMYLLSVSNPRVLRRLIPCRSRKSILLFLIIFLSLSTPQALAQLQTTATYNIEERINLTEVGDGEISLLMKFPDTSSYHRSKQLFGNNKYLLVRQMARHLSKYLLEIGEPEYNDTNRELKVYFKARGMAVCRQGQWEIEAEEGVKLISKHDNMWIFNYTASAPVGVFSEHIYLQFPKQARDITFDEASKSVKFRLPEKYKKKGGKLDVDVKYRETLMSCVYKIYGDPKLGFGNYWVAKLILKNSGKGKIEDIKIRYRVRDYSDWTVPNTYSVLPPGGTIVDLYYPQLSQEAAKLTSRTPATLEVEYSYKGAAPVQGGKTIYIRGKNEFEHSDITTREADPGLIILQMPPFWPPL